ncbi:MAG: hypothetical protein JWO43_663 [Candidatus Adlerbacteria bacterium]|nr:hypothetical protein [Candidatus Adlerbacteria bacterium]
MKTWIWVVLVVIVIGGGAYYFSHLQSVSSVSPANSQTQQLQVQILGVEPQTAPSSPILKYSVSGAAPDGSKLGIYLMGKDKPGIYWWSDAKFGTNSLDLTGLPNKGAGANPGSFPKGNYFLQIEDARTGSVVATSPTFLVP